MRYLTSDCATMVETIRVSWTGSFGGEWHRVKRHGQHVADVRTIGEPADLGIDWADLHEFW